MTFAFHVLRRRDENDWPTLAAISNILLVSDNDNLGVALEIGVNYEADKPLQHITTSAIFNVRVYHLCEVTRGGVLVLCCRVAGGSAPATWTTLQSRLLVPQ